ncbi:ABC transporter substrate-binding protein [Azospirillum agricola]|uniref:ABC transporter substrate-binding protein n=1 Tax=Azospirillum agricola TaxID=1720247 RepID=UPI000A0EF678|nr:ABC transporter substrate-binding protein [Azospirillum agricola]SMH30853.1 amino acid/amide ABC transporter substrate-binding protein, HAAT family [Azospirillum lipoferum]
MNKPVSKPITRALLAATAVLALGASFWPAASAAAQSGAAQPAAATTPAATGPIRIGVLTDLSGSLADLSGRGSVEAVKMAVEDFGASVLGRPVEVLAADHQNKADVGTQIAADWYDNKNVEVVIDLPNSAVMLAIQELTRRKNKIVFGTAGGSSDFTGKACSPNGIHWVYDTYALAAGTGKTMVKQGGDSWYFITLDYSFGLSLERDTAAFVTGAGGKVLGAARHPLNSADFSSYLLQAQSSKAKVIGLANAGGDLINTVKQAAEFGVTQQGQKLAGLLMFLSDIHALGLATAQGLVLTESFYWDQNEGTRAFSKRFFERTGRMPTMVQAGNYGAITHYLKAVKAAGTSETAAVMKTMRDTPINDFMTRDGRIREDGRVLRDMYLFEVKTPAESKGPWDYYKQLGTVAAADAARPLAESECPLVRNAASAAKP